MFLTAILVAALVMLSSAVVIIVTRRAADGRLGRNEFAGVRTKATTASDAAWLAAHRSALPATQVGCSAGVAAGVIGLVIAPATPTGSLVASAVASLLTLGAVVIGGIAGQGAARRTAD